MKRLLVLVGCVVLLAGLAVWFFLCRQSRRKIRNILLISIDTCRADYLSCYGYPDKITPNIDAIASEGILFENVVSPVPLTLPAHASMLTGTTPLYHGIHDNLGYQLGDSNVTLAEIMREQGYKTSAIIGAFVLDSQFGLDQGFDTYDDNFGGETRGTKSERKADEASRIAVRWLQKHKDKGFFLFLHYYDPHYKYEPPEPHASEFRDNPYAGEIAYTDRCIGLVMDELKSLGVYDSTLIIITSDHGEMLGEHGEAEHGYFVYQSAIKVPLIFKLPGRNVPMRINNLVSLNDIVPTICGLLAIQSPPQTEGMDLSRYFSRRKVLEQERLVYCESLLPTKHNASSLLGVVTDGWKYIQTTRPELYNLNKDPQEKTNLMDREPQRARLLRGHLELILDEASRRDVDSKLELDEEGRRRLESLGYIASRTVGDKLKFDPNKPDPKDLVKFHNIRAYNESALHLAQQGRLMEAGEAYKRIIDHYEKVEMKHAMGTVHFNLAMVQKGLGQEAAAEGTLRRAVQCFREEVFNSPSDKAYERLGDALAELGDFEGARESFGKALALNPANVLLYIKLTKAFEYQGHYDEGIHVLEKGIQFMSYHEQKENMVKLQEHLEQLKLKRQSNGDR